MELVEIGGRVKDAAAFKEAYDSEVKDFMMRHGKYQWPDYDESEAQDMHKSLVESGTIIDYIMWGRLSRRNYVLDGPEGAKERERATAMQRMTAVVVWDQDSRKLVGSALTGASDMEDGSGQMDDGTGKLGAHLKKVLYGSRRSPLEFQQLLEEPGRVAPPEGHGVWLYAGGAGLPIPEGCSSTSRQDGQDGQSHPGDV
jgi:hypothetical protein